jgi:hypothetical protein
MARKKPLPRSQRKVVNRAREYKRTDDTVKNVSVGLMDMDSAIMYYFENVIKPTVIDNEETVKVPVMYASPERWFAIQKSGFLRDAKRQLILPAIVFRRTGFARDDAITIDKLDANDPKLHYTFERKYSDKNRYDNFSVQQGIFPQKEYYNVAVPDYVTLSYDFIIWTHYIEHMNKIAEKVNWSDGSYWGEPGKMKFRTRIDNFTDATEVSDRERVVKTEFSITLHGYLLPEAFNDLVTTQKHLTPKRLVIKSETDLDISSIVKLEEGVQEVRVSGKSASSQKIITDNPLIIEQGTGVTVSNSGTEWIGADRLVQNISIPQEVSTNSNVTFNQITASDSLHIGTTSLDLSETGVSGDWNVIGSLGATGNLSIDGNATIQGDLTAQSFNTEFVSSSVIYQSGSTKFGDDISDTHQFTGSVQLSGSIIANEINLTSGVTISEISNDPTLADESQTAVPTEHAVKTYVDDKDSYLRKHFVKIASSIIGTSTASFTAATASAPTGMTSTSENDFLFFLNGQYMEHDALTIQQAGSTFYLKVDTDSIGYDLETDDEIISWGKFNS